jgi:tRNA threonylcarbamoyladenosine biosynthesis protein TsaE
MEFLSKSLEDTGKIASEFAANLKPNEKMATIVGLYGELGSGKTTFMKYLAEAFGVKEEVKSPTFVIMKKFGLSLNGETEYLIHIDAYRIENPEEMLALGWKGIISDPKNIICIEWPEKIAGIMPPHIVIKFEHVSENERKISIA